MAYWVPKLATCDIDSLSADELAVWISEHNIKLLTKQAAEHQCRTLRVWHKWQLKAREQGRLRGVIFKGPPSLDTSVFRCSLCGFSCHSGAALSGHLAARHAHSNFARLFVEGSHCRICLKQFWTIPRLLRHLSGATSCLAQLAVTFEAVREVDDVFPACAVEALEAESEYDTAPALRLCGPLRPVPPNALEVLPGIVHSLDPFARTALIRSAAAFNGRYGCSEIFEVFLEANAPAPRNRGPAIERPMNPDGRRLLAQCIELSAT